MRHTKNFLSGLYRTMLRIRLCEESLVAPILGGEIKTPCHLYSGQEAVATGICAALKKTDYVFGNHRSHGHYLAKGGDMKEMVAEIFCKESGCSRGRGGSMHLIAPECGMLGAAPIVAGTISLAVGAALASSIREDGRVTVSFFGDGATGEGVLYESLNLAALRSLPVVFVCENNLYATHMPICECRPHNNIFKAGASCCIESKRVDGNDVMKVYKTAQKAVENCRQGRGPVFIECMTYRQRGHVGPDDNVQGSHTDIRPQTEIARWLRKDPIKRFESFLSKEGVLDKADFAEIRKEVECEVAEAHSFAKSSAYPEKGALELYVYSGQNASV